MNSALNLNSVKASPPPKNHFWPNLSRLHDLSPMYKILVADPISDSGISVFQGHNGTFKIDNRSKLSGDDLKKAVADVDAIIVRSETRITADVLAACKKVKIVGRAGVGVDNIDVQAASKQGVIVVNV